MLAGKVKNMLTYHPCNLCPRACGADRSAGKTGFCGLPGQLTAARAALHYWEEPVISGKNGSGAVFFSGCTLRCIYCQNGEISHENHGKQLDSKRLRDIFEELIAQGAHNINLVTPTQFLPDILPALTPKLPVPVVYNCGGYESIETLRELEGLVDVYLPDMKYSSPELAKKLSSAENYPEIAKAAIREMQRQTGNYVLQDGLLKKGVLLRHLVLPGQVENSLAVIDWIADTFHKGELLVSLMSQYVPMGRAKKQPPFDRRLTAEEYDGVVSWMELCGITEGFTQDYSAASVEYVPDFSNIGI